MRLVDHFIVGGTGGLAAGRRAAVMDPNNGGQQAEVVLGGADALVDGDSVVGDSVADYGWQYFMARPGTIFAGANEIQRNVLAKSVLGLGSK